MLGRGGSNSLCLDCYSQTEDEGLLEKVSIKDKLNDDKDCSSNGTLPTKDLNNNQIQPYNASEEKHFKAPERKPRSEKQDRSRHRSDNDRHQKCHPEVLRRISNKDEELSGIFANKNGKLEHCDENGENSRSNLKGKAQSSSDWEKLGSAKEAPRKSRTSKSSKGSSQSLLFAASGKHSKTSNLVSVADDRSPVRPKNSEAQNEKRKKCSRGKRSVSAFAQESDSMESSQPKSKRAKTKHVDPQSGCDSEEPCMSFESYLNYDENVSKRREKLAVKKSKRALREGKDQTPYMKTSTSRLCTASDKPVSGSLKALHAGND